jgi:hypothetical protein
MEHKLELIAFPDGRLRVNGPLHDKKLCYDMLDAAREIVRQFDVSKALANEQKKVPPGLRSV